MSPETLRAIVEALAREVAGFRRQLGDSNITTDEVIADAWAEVEENKAKGKTS